MTLKELERFRKCAVVPLDDNGNDDVAEALALRLSHDASDGVAVM